MDENYLDLIAGIRKRPGMYLCSPNQKGLNILTSTLIDVFASGDRVRDRQIEIELKSPETICLTVDSVECIKPFALDPEIMFCFWKFHLSQGENRDLFNFNKLDSLTIANAISSTCKFTVERERQSVKIEYERGLFISFVDTKVQNKDYLSIELTIDRHIFTAAVFEVDEIEEIVNQISYFYPNVKFQIDASNLVPIRLLLQHRSRGVKQLITETIDLLHPFDALSYYREPIVDSDIFHATISDLDRQIVGELLVGTLPEINATSLVCFVNRRRACLTNLALQKFQNKLNKIIIERLNSTDIVSSKASTIAEFSIYPGLICLISIHTNQSIFAGPTRDYIQGELVDLILSLLLDRLDAELNSHDENTPGLFQQLYRTALYDY